MWNITGTANQQAILRDAMEAIKFPWPRLTQLPGTPEMGWDDLNRRSEVRGHEGHHDADPADPNADRADPLLGQDEQGREWTMGVIYIVSGRIYLDVRLEAQPDLAKAVVAAEIAHAVDLFMPMTDEQRNEFLRLWGKGGTWWEVSDYGAEYYRLGGEAFMHEFVEAYTDLSFGDKSAFMHDVGVEPADTRRILGIERTDYVAPVEPTAIQIVRYGRSRVYHLATHRVRSRNGQYISDAVGLKPCKVCKP